MSMRQEICAVCGNVKTNSICGLCEYDPSEDSIFEELLRLDFGRRIRIEFDPLIQKGEYVDRTVGDQTYRIFRVR